MGELNRSLRAARERGDFRQSRVRSYLYVTGHGHDGACTEARNNDRDIQSADHLHNVGETTGQRL
jgi:hypothetical protein